MSKKTKAAVGAAVAAGATAAAVAGTIVAKKMGRKTTVIHVRPHGDDWEVGDHWELTIEGNQRASKTFPTKEEAVKAGREMAHERTPSELLIHRTDGSEQERHTYQA